MCNIVTLVSLYRTTVWLYPYKRSLNIRVYPYYRENWTLNDDISRLYTQYVHVFWTYYPQNCIILLHNFEPGSILCKQYDKSARSG